MAEKFDLSVVLRFMTKGDNKLNGIGKKFKNLGSSMTKVGKTMSLAVTAPIVGFGANAIRIGADFQETMNMVGAVTEATGKDFDKLKLKARELGSTTQFSARQAAEAMKFMGMAGMDTNKILGASPKVLELAAAAQLDMASAADIVTNIMAGFGYEAKDLAGVNDVLVDTFTNSNVSLSQLGQALKKVGPMAKSLNVPFNDVAAALGILGNAGIQGEEAGTGLKTMFVRLLNPSKEALKAMRNFELQFFNTDGTIKSISGVVKEFENALAEGADQTELTAAATEIFGTRGIQIISALVSQGSSELDKLNAKLGVKDENGLGSAARIAKRQMEGLPGAIKLVTSAWESLNIALTEGKLGEVVNNLGRDLAGLITKVTEFIQTHPEMVKWGLVVAGIFAAAGPLLIGLGMASIALGALLSPIGLVVAAIAGVGVAAWVIYDHWDEIKGLLLGVWESIKNAGITAWETLTNSWNESVEKIKQMGIDVKERWLAIFGEISTFISNLWSAVIPESISSGIEKIKGIVTGLKDSIISIFGAIPQWFTDLWNVTIPDTITSSIEKIKGIATEAIKGVLPDFIENRLFAPEMTNQAKEGISNNSTSEVTIKVQAADGTTATVEGLRQSGDTKTRVQSDTSVGNTVPAFAG